jgi:hypothetical protein
MSVRLITDVIPVWHLKVLMSLIMPLHLFLLGLFGRVHRRQRPACSRCHKEPQGDPGLHSKFKLQTPILFRKCGGTMLIRSLLVHSRCFLISRRSEGPPDTQNSYRFGKLRLRNKTSCFPTSFMGNNY